MQKLLPSPRHVMLSYNINLKCSAGKTICSCLSIQEHHSSKHAKNQCPDDTEAPIAKTLEYHGPTMPYMRIEDPSGISKLPTYQQQKGQTNVQHRWFIAGQRSCILSSVMNFSSNLRRPRVHENVIEYHMTMTVHPGMSPVLQLEGLIVQPFQLPPDASEAFETCGPVEMLGNRLASSCFGCSFTEWRQAQVEASPGCPNGLGVEFGSKKLWHIVTWRDTMTVSILWASIFVPPLLPPPPPAPPPP